MLKIVQEITECLTVISYEQCLFTHENEITNGLMFILNILM